MKTAIFAFVLIGLTATSDAVEPYKYKSQYSSSSIKNKYGRTIGRRETITNSAAKTENFFNKQGQKTASVRSPIQKTLSSGRKK